ncbi:MAG: hypothetical protein WC340_00105 [Kiritimatiellia bacterium]
MKYMINKAVLVTMAVFMTVGAAYAMPSVTDVVMTQREGTRIVDITYYLTGEAAIVTLSIETNGEFDRTSLREDWHDVILTKAFYAGIYEVTQSQWYHVMGKWTSHFNNTDYTLTRPVEQVSYNDIRGSFAQGGGGVIPA